jgi:hypothetical protein
MGLAEGLAGQEREALAALLIEAEGPRSALEADVLQVPQHRVHSRRPRLRGAADLVIDQDGAETASTGKPSLSHLTVLPRPALPGDRLTSPSRSIPL